MGCGHSGAGKGFDSPDKSIIAMKAALLIQGWYRRYLARLEAKRQCTWSIFQNLEYAGEQDQLRLYNFFNDMMTQLELATLAEGPDSSRKGVIAAVSLFKRHTNHESMEKEDEELWEQTNPDAVDIPANYKGPHITFPLTTTQIECLIDAFKNKEVLHCKYVLQILHETRRALKQLPNISHVSVKGRAKQLTVVGDLHGKLDDLLFIFYKNGLPDRNNPYLFNGDIVDRGPHSVELCMLIFSYSLLFPGSIFINRGNHEDHVMNLRYGFVKELVNKYKDQAAKLVNLFEEVFSWLPLASVIDKQILVTHGGVSDRTDLAYLASINRHAYVSILRPPTHNGNGVDALEWRQVLDILWSDPRAARGCEPNEFRGGGVYWGPDVTQHILKKNRFKLIIRSHECKQEGYEYMHNDQVLTIFSASNYYEVGSNKGAYIKLGPDLTPRIVQFIVTKQAQKQMSISSKLNLVEASAIQGLREKICANKSALLENFKTHDPQNTGEITVTQWAGAMRHVLCMDLPWRNMKTKLVKSNAAGLVEYQTTFEQFKVQNKLKDETAGSVTEVLYRNKDSLETIFRAIDTDNSGYISVAEFQEACALLGQHTKSNLSHSEIKNMGRNMDMNNDGYIDFNEFLEAFRIVDQFGRDLERRKSVEKDMAKDESIVGSS